MVLKEGDVVYIESREAESFYTGGLLPGGESRFPRDNDLDVLGAMAFAALVFPALKEAVEGSVSKVSRSSAGDALYPSANAMCNGKSPLKWTLPSNQRPREDLWYSLVNVDPSL